MSITPYLGQLDWLRMRLRHLYSIEYLTYLVLLRRRLSTIFDNFEFKHNRTTRDARVPCDTLIRLNPPKYRTEFYKRLFCSLAAEL